MRNMDTAEVDGSVRKARPSQLGIRTFAVGDPATTSLRKLRPSLRGGVHRTNQQMLATATAAVKGARPTASREMVPSPTKRACKGKQQVERTLS